MPRGSAVRIGVLALQGAFEEHIACFRRLGVDTFEVRVREELKGLDGLVIPGGESTTMTRLMRDYDLTAPVRDLCRDGLPVMGTCAGMILLSDGVSDIGASALDAMDIRVRRNGFGRQVDSFEFVLSIPAIGYPPFHAVFIRAPFIDTVGESVEVLARLPDGTAVAARQGNMLALSFHPELTDDLRLHAYFVDIVKSSVKR
ncbi:MAG: pyridoxal 5'-phosphate synthase glutaminase subunit PdxT [Chloroflexota bacterium]|nr:pyridoxal 5'-phosphate synthase glutaminase subunit PdxT [Chloroflexota bacterium]